MATKDIQGRFLSKENFLLAWKRVLRSKHAVNKDRIALRAFALQINENLEILIEEIKNGVYSPSFAPKIYIPKTSRTLRTLPVLSPRDRIVYQAIGNLIIQESEPDLSIVANRNVFAHIPKRNNSLFTLVNWREQFKRFTKAYERIWKIGNKWVVKTDISSYYDSIDHGLLLDLIRERWISDEMFIKLLKECLLSWTTHDGGSKFSRGLPQGYEVSDILATLFLLPVDESMVKTPGYLRYVDDIRILTSSRNNASRALVKLDVEMKKIALVLQTKKTSLEEINNIEDEKTKLQTNLSQISILIEQGKKQQTELKELFFQSWNRLDEAPDISDTAIAFTLYRLDADTTVRNIALRLLELLPWRSSIINHYLQKFPNDHDTIQGLLKHIFSHKVYGWHLANCMRTISKISKTDDYRAIALDWLENKNLQWFQRLAAVEALQEDQDSHAALSTAIKDVDNLILKEALIVSCAFQAHQTGSNSEIARLINRSLSHENIQIKLLGIWLHQQFDDISWEDINYTDELSYLAKLLPELSNQDVEAPCFIKYTLRKEYDVEISEKLDFKQIFDDYVGTVDDFRKAFPYYYTDPSLYIGFINSFNHRISILLKKYLKLTIPNEEYGNILKSQEFNNNVPQVSLYFTMCNDLRNQTSGFHPFASALGTWSQPISHKKKKEVHKGLKLAYQEFVNYLQSCLGIN
jgi:retron-type reverse transcriptase